MKNRFGVYRKKIHERIEQNRIRKLTSTYLTEEFSGKYIIRDSKKLINFCSNDYLNLSLDPRVCASSIAYTQKYGTGSRSSRLISGNLDCHTELETALATFFGTEAALIFNTGYQGNISIISCLSDKNTIIYADKLSHNSLLQGCLLSGAQLNRFRHNDIKHLKQLLEKSDRHSQKLIITESLFSMDGDIAPLDELCEVAEAYNALLLVDDAHAVGMFGRGGKGLTFGRKRIDFVTGTFGKSFGSLGGYVLCSNEMKDYFVNFASGFIYSTGIQPSTVGAVLEGLNRIPYLEDERSNILELSKKLRFGLEKLGFSTCNSSSHIVPMLTGSDKSTLRLAGYLYENGIFAAAIRPPTVPENTARIRFSLTTAHNIQDIEHLLTSIQSFVKNEKASG